MIKQLLGKLFGELCCLRAGGDSYAYYLKSLRCANRWTRRCRNLRVQRANRRVVGARTCTGAILNPAGSADTKSVVAASTPKPAAEPPPLRWLRKLIHLPARDSEFGATEPVAHGMAEDGVLKKAVEFPAVLMAK